MARIAQAASLVFMGDAAQAAIAIEEAADAAERSPELASDFQLRAYLGITLAFAERGAGSGAILDALIEAVSTTPRQPHLPADQPLLDPPGDRRWEDARSDALRAFALPASWAEPATSAGGSAC